MDLKLAFQIQQFKHQLSLECVKHMKQRDSNMIFHNYS
jgi:hypothetical protein